MEYWWLWLLLIPLGIFALMLLLFMGIIIAALWEKRKVISFLIPEPGQEFTVGDYARNANQIIQHAGLQHYGTFHDGTSSLYKIRYDLWLTPDNLTMVNVGGGTLAGFPVKGTWFVSKLADSRYLVTTDETGASDLSALTELEIWTDVGTVYMADRHSHRVKSSPVPVLPFSDNPLAEYVLRPQRQVQRMVETGHARFLDPQQTTWKYTLKGALKYYFVAMWLQPYTKMK